jgi:thioredoxin 1
VRSTPIRAYNLRELETLHYTRKGGAGAPPTGSGEPVTPLTSIPLWVYFERNEHEREVGIMADMKDIDSQEFDSEVLASDVPVVVDFWAPWCMPCRMVAPELEKLQSKVGDKAKFVKVNVDENQEIAMRYGVMSIPTIAKFEGGELATQVVGARGADDMGRQFGLV